MNNEYVIGAIFVSSIVTFVPRVLPFLIVKKVKMPDLVLRFLGYLPVCIIFALGFSSLFATEPGSLPKILYLECLASLLTLWVAFRYGNLIWTVLIGVTCVGLFRLFF